jgi:hypothetical protein
MADRLLACVGNTASWLRTDGPTAVGSPDTMVRAFLDAVADQYFSESKMLGRTAAPTSSFHCSAGVWATGALVELHKSNVPFTRRSYLASVSLTPVTRAGMGFSDYKRRVVGAGDAVAKSSVQVSIAKPFSLHTTPTPDPRAVPAKYGPRPTPTPTAPTPTTTLPRINAAYLGLR